MWEVWLQIALQLVSHVILLHCSVNFRVVPIRVARLSSLAILSVIAILTALSMRKSVGAAVARLVSFPALEVHVLVNANRGFAEVTLRTADVIVRVHLLYLPSLALLTGTPTMRLDWNPTKPPPRHTRPFSVASQTGMKILLMTSLPFTVSAQ